MGIHFEIITRIFEEAERERRTFLLEHEVYALLAEAGFEIPRFFFLPAGEEAPEKALKSLGSETLVLKIVSPLVVHKTEVGGVRFVRNEPEEVNRACREMMRTVLANLRDLAKRPGSGIEKHGKPSGRVEMEKEIRGILVCEKVDHEEVGFGGELLLGLRNSREFGPVVTMGAGGLDVEYLASVLKEEKALAIGSAHLPGGKDGIHSLLSRQAVYQKLTGEFRGKKPRIAGEELAAAFTRFLELGRHFSALKPGRGFVIEEAEINPLVVRAGRLVPLDGVCRFSRNRLDVKSRPFEMIGHLLHPRNIAIIGVSEKMNIGRVILRNILGQGFPVENVYIVKPGTAEIDGCLCVPSVRDLPRTVDLFVLTLAAEQSIGVMEELITHEKARSVIIIAGGMGEKKGGEELEERIRELLRESRDKGWMTPVVNGGNCLGIYSKPGRFDTTFIPDYKLAKPAGRKAGLVYISQSGAFMISRMSKSPHSEPLYAVSLGNQVDLTASDYLRYLSDEEDARIFALYIEGFQPGDGLRLAEAAGRIASRPGEMVVVYKAGRTPEGRAATSSHTASVAGDYRVCRSILESAGVFMAGTISEFESAVKFLPALIGKSVRGNRVGLISNAGFECVIMADNLINGEEFRPASFSPETVKRITGILSPLGIDRLQDVRNPLDVTPVADDGVFAGCVEAMLDDENVDCAVVSPVPMTPAMQTLPPARNHSENLHDPAGIAGRLTALFRKTGKPFVVNIDAGDRYDPLAEALEEAGIPVFRRCDEAVRFLRKFVHTRLEIK